MKIVGQNSSWKETLIKIMLFFLKPLIVHIRRRISFSFDNNSRQPPGRKKKDIIIV